MFIINKILTEELKPPTYYHIDNLDNDYIDINNIGDDQKYPLFGKVDKILLEYLKKTNTKTINIKELDSNIFNDEFLREIISPWSKRINYFGKLFVKNISN